MNTNVWVPWSLVTNDPSYFYNAGKMQGLGENLIARVFGGTAVTGKNYDVEIAGSPWEVKESACRSQMIRPGVDGREAWQNCYKEIDDALDSLEKFCAAYKKFSTSVAGFKKWFHSETLVCIDQILELYSVEMRNSVARGEVSKSRLQQLQQIFSLACEVKNSLSAGTALAVRNSKITMSGIDHTLDADTELQVIRLVSLSLLQKGSQTVDPRPGLLSYLDSKLFASSEYFNTLMTSLSPSNIFNHVEGVFIVNASGFYAIPTTKIDESLRLVRISQCTPRYELTDAYPAKERPRSKSSRKKVR